MKVIGVDLGGTKLATILFNDKGKVLDKRFASIGDREGSEVGKLIIKELEGVLSKNNDVTSIGISVPGIYNQENGNVWAPNISGWKQYPLYEEVKSILYGADISISIDSDRSCYILGEFWQGNAKDCKNAIFVAVGTGIGAGILVDGSVLRGISASAGAVGWMALSRPHLKEYSSYGCFESHASGEGITRMAKKYMSKNSSYEGILRKRANNNLKTKDVFEAYNMSDPIAERVINEAIQFWGMATANLVSIFNPEKIIFGGGVFETASEMISSIREEAKRWSQPIAMEDVSIEVAGLGNEAGIYGAGYLAISNQKSN